MPDGHQVWKIKLMTVEHDGRADVRKEKYMEEYIKRKDALDIFSKYMFAGYRGNGKSFFSEIVMPTFYCAIEELPSADVRENKHGEWQITDAYPHNVYCSECHERFAQTHWAVWEDGSLPRNFCPNCGADMRGGTNG